MEALLGGRYRAALLLALLLATSFAMRGTLAATFSGITGHTTTFTTAALYDASNWTGSVTEGTTDIKLVWANAGGGHSGDGFSVYSVQQATNATCSTALTSYTWLKAVASTSTGTTDATKFGAALGINQGSWMCYLARAWSVPGAPYTSWTASTTPQWTSQITPLTPSQPLGVGYFAYSAAVANGGTAGIVDAGDTITIKYDQQTNAPSLTGTYVCFSKVTGTTYTVYLGGGVSGTSCTSTGMVVGQLNYTGGSYGCSKDQPFNISSAAWSKTTYTSDTLTITIGTKANANCSSVTPGGTAGTFVPATSGADVQSSSGAAQPCTANSPFNCEPAVSGSF
jgi:hypothetical protein